MTKNSDSKEYLTKPAYDRARNAIAELRQKGHSWDDIRNMKYSKTFSDFSVWQEFMSDISPEWIQIDYDEYVTLVEMAVEAEKSKEKLDTRGKSAILTSGDEVSDVSIPRGKGRSWEEYRTTLKNSGFSEESIDRIEKQTFDTLKHLSVKTEGKPPVKGLVIGNVQSGKTANMAGLMAMAADNGWNYFIVLTGLTENLRHQTEKRLRADLEKDTNLVWDYINYNSMADKQFPYDKFSKSNRVFFSVVLKQSNRLKQLVTFLQKAPNPEKFKIMIIDDEADQGSINTGKIEDEKQRKALNKEILNLVYGRKDPKAESKGFGAINYVAYTATPYANCLNEFKSTDKKVTLYPEDFIFRLEPGRGYFGPDTIFGLPDSDIADRLNIVNFIPVNEVEQIRDIESEKSLQLPESLKKSILWFLCAAAVQRSRDYKKPLSMLIHTSYITDDHKALYRAVKKWINDHKDKLIDECEKVYKSETERFTLTDLKTTYPTYEYLNEIKDYPEFNILIPYLEELLAQVTGIQLEIDEKELIYNPGIIICVDNSKNKDVDEENKHLRLVYPNKTQLQEMGYAPAFIVIGGNTLSRGLTIEGLVSSYFLRNSIQADSLMQMGRWFGYRKGYELLPRIWMTHNTFEKFQFLVEIDEDLRNQITKMAALGKRPEDFRLTLVTHPKASWLRLTATKKMQSARKVQLDYSGTDMQLVTYTLDSYIQQKNNRIVEKFLISLGEPVRSENGPSGIWTDIEYSKIDDEIFKNGFEVVKTSKAFQDMDVLREWIEKQTKRGNFRNWTVILAGTKLSDDQPEKNYCLPGTEFRIGKVNRSGMAASAGKFTIKALTSKRDYLAHLHPQDFEKSGKSSLTWDKLIKEKRISDNYKEYLEAADADHTPILLIYCVDQNSKPLRNTKDPENSIRKPLRDLGVKEDFFGLAMVIPGEKGTHSEKLQIDNSFYSTEEGEEYEN